MVYVVGGAGGLAGWRASGNGLVDRRVGRRVYMSVGGWAVDSRNSDLLV